MFIRYTTAISSGSVITLGLFYLMQTLIQLQPGAEIHDRERFVLAWLTDNPPEELQVDEMKPVDKSFVTPPAVPSGRPEYHGDSTHTAVSTAVVLPKNSDTTIAPGVFSDAPLVTIVRVQPVYPARAREEGLEGYVIVQFDVLANGSVHNVSIVESTHTVFDRAAIRATQKFRFKPRVVDGVPQQSSGLQNLFRFEMDH